MDSVQEKYPSKYDYILSEETSFKTNRVPLATNWDWNMFEHVDMSFQLKNSKFPKTVNDHKRPFKNIIIPIANVNYRTEGFDVKNIEVFVNDSDNYHKSLLARKFHTKWAKKFSIDTAIDETVESYFDYGLALVKNTNQERPEIIQLQQIAFCDQTNILSGPICLKHQFSISELEEMRGKWRSDQIDRVINAAKFTQDVSNDREAKTPGKYIEIYELHGTFPDNWLDNGDEDTGKYIPQMQIISYYVDQTTQQKNGITLFDGKEPKSIFKAVKRDNIHGRACGRGGIEELFDAQIWTNYSEIQLKEMLDAAATMILKTTDKKFANTNKLSDLKKNQIFTLEEGKDISQVAITPQNKFMFDQYINQWEQSARVIGSASDPALGLNPVSGTPLGTTQIVTNQGEGIHDYRRGKIATFWGEIYRDWVLGYLSKEMIKGDKWVDELTLEELQEVADKLATKESNKRLKDKLLSGKMVTEQEQELFRQTVKDSFLKGGKRRFLNLMKGELKDLPLDVDFNIAGKQKNLVDVVNKLNGIFRTVFANPAILQSTGMGELFNNILEYSGLSPINFTSFTQQPAQPQQPTQSPIQPGQIQTNQLASNPTQ